MKYWLQHCIPQHLIYICLCASIILTSCSTYKTVDLSILTPPELNISDISELNILSNVGQLEANAIHRQVNINIASGDSVIITKKRIGVDSVDVLALEGCIAHINLPEYFTQITKIKTPNFEKVYSKTINDLFNKYPSDGILILQEANYTVDIYNFYYNYEKIGEPELQITTQSQWVVYYDNNITKSFQFSIKDTLYWNEIDAHLSSFLEEALWNNGKKAAHKLSPEWQTVNRLYFAGENQLIRQAHKQVIQNDWAAAATNWLTIYNGRKKPNTQKGRMAFNMALYSECENKLQLAIEWLDTAEAIFTTCGDTSELSLCEMYRNVLTNRVKSAQELDKIFQ